MTNKRYGVACLRIGLLTALITAVFWAIWSLFAPVPDGGTLKITENLVYFIALSRWYDVPSAFLVVNVYGWILRGLFLTTQDKLSFDDFVAGLVIGLLIGLFIGLGFGLGVGLLVSILIGLGFGLGVGLALAVKMLFSLDLWKKVYCWLIASDLN